MDRNGSGFSDAGETPLRYTDAVTGPVSAPNANDPWIGRTIDDRYRVDERLGEGGMGAVYVAEHLKLGKRVAFKVIHPEFHGEDAVAARFAREALASGQLEHPHIAGALDFGSLPEGGAYLVLQLVQGPSLQDTIDASGGVSVADACVIAAQVADALAAAHGRDIIHRDLKPENVLLDAQHDGPWARVLDFGIARTGKTIDSPQAAGQPPLTAEGTIIGTPGYMSPEQALGQTVDNRTDLYSLGVLLWEMLTGKALFHGADLAAVLTEQLTSPPTPPSAASPNDVPAALDALVLRLLQPKPENRFASASEVRDLLHGLSRAEAPHGPVSRAGSHSTKVDAFAETRLADTERADTKRSDTERSSPAPRVPPTPNRPLPQSLLWSASAVAALLVFLLAGVAVTTLASRFAVGETGTTASARPVLLAKDAVTALPPVVRERFETLLGPGTRPRDRKGAARALLAARDDTATPAWLIAAARFELAGSCEQKRARLAALVAQGEPATRPALERISRAPRRGCGFLDLADCYGCLRGDVAKALGFFPRAKSPGRAVR